MDKFLSIFDRVICSSCDSCWVLPFHIFFYSVASPITESQMDLFKFQEKNGYLLYNPYFFFFFFLGGGWGGDTTFFGSIFNA